MSTSVQNEIMKTEEESQVWINHVIKQEIIVY